MPASLKDENRPYLLAALTANFAVFYGAQQTHALFGGNWSELTQGIAKAIPAALGLVIVGIINAQLSPVMKARIVFLRWNNPLPGSEAFTRYGPRDARVNMETIERLFGPLPTDLEKQNKLWYWLYKTVEHEPSVQQAHREFLFARDYACLSLMMLVLLCAAAGILVRPFETFLGYSALLFIQLLLTWRAARQHGCSFVTNVLAVKASAQQTPKRTSRSK